MGGLLLPPGSAARVLASPELVELSVLEGASGGLVPGTVNWLPGDTAAPPSLRAGVSVPVAGFPEEAPQEEPQELGSCRHGGPEPPGCALAAQRLLSVLVPEVRSWPQQAAESLQEQQMLPRAACCSPSGLQIRPQLGLCAPPPCAVPQFPHL